MANRVGRLLSGARPFGTGHYSPPAAAPRTRCAVSALTGYDRPRVGPQRKGRRTSRPSVHSKKPLFLASLLALACTVARSETVESDQIRVIDGDTVDLAGEHICLVEPHAPTISKPRCKTELAKGLLASEHLRQFLKVPARIERSGWTDNYGRILALMPGIGEGPQVAHSGPQAHCCRG